MYTHPESFCGELRGRVARLEAGDRPAANVDSSRLSERGLKCRVGRVSTMIVDSNRKGWVTDDKPGPRK